MNRDSRRAEKRKRRGAAALAILAAAMLAAGPLADDVALASSTDDLIVYGGGGGGGGGTGGSAGGGGGGYIQYHNNYVSGVGGYAGEDDVHNGTSGRDGGKGGVGTGGGGTGGSGGERTGYFRNATIGVTTIDGLVTVANYGEDSGVGGEAKATANGNLTLTGDLVIVAGAGGNGSTQPGFVGGAAEVTAADLTLHGDLAVASGKKGDGGDGGDGGSATLTVDKLTAASGNHVFEFDMPAPSPAQLTVNIGELALSGSVTMKFSNPGNFCFDDIYNLTQLTFSGGSLTINDNANLGNRTLKVEGGGNGEVPLIKANGALSGTVILDAHPSQTAWIIKDSDNVHSHEIAASISSYNLGEFLAMYDVPPSQIYAVFPAASSWYTPPSAPQKFIEVYGIRVNYTIDAKGIVTVNLDKALLDRIVEAAMEDNKDNKIIGFNFEVEKALKGLNVTIPPEWFEDNRDITLSMLTGIGGSNINRDITRRFPDVFGNGTARYQSGSLILEFSQSGKAVTWDSFIDPLVIYVPYTPKSGEVPETLALFDKDTGEIVANSFYKNGRVYGAVNRPGRYEVAAVPISLFGMEDHWAKGDVMFAISHRLLESDSTGGIFPDDAITRADFLTALGKMSGADVSEYTTSSFTDVADGDAAMPYIEWAFENGIVYGVGDDMFAPDAPIAREEAAVMMGRYAEATGRTLPLMRLAESYADQRTISGWATTAVAGVQRANVITGKPGRIYDPRGSMTRAEASAILRRFAESVTLGRMGWVQNDEGGWLYIRNDYLAVKGWFTDADDSKYWFDEDGIRAEDMWVEIEGAWYFFYEDGKLATSTTVDGYTVGKDGKRVE